MRTPRRLVLLTAMAGLLLVLPAGPALAHGRGSDATNYVSRLTDVPQLSGVTWEVYGNDEYLALTNTSDTELTVLGYEDEPYLRVGPEGVFENVNSPAVYLNSDRFGQVDVPASADPQAGPDWRRVSGGQTVLWHDHRIHWMAATPPQAVAADPGSEQVVYDDWAVPFRYDGETRQVRGELLWLPGANPVPWLLGALAVTLLALVGLATKPEGDERWPGLARPAAVVLGLLAAANLVHLADDLLAVPLPLPTIALAAGQTALFILIAAFGALRGWQAREGAFTALGVGSAALLLGQGVLYLGVLTASQSASIFPMVVTRAVVALSIAQVVPIGLVAVLGTRRLLPPVDAEPAMAEPIPAGEQLSGGAPQ